MGPFRMCVIVTYLCYCMYIYVKHGSVVVDLVQLVKAHARRLAKQSKLCRQTLQ